VLLFGARLQLICVLCFVDVGNKWVTSASSIDWLISVIYVSLPAWFALILLLPNNDHKISNK
jgi:hypothetical protein